MGPDRVRRIATAHSFAVEILVPGAGLELTADVDNS